MPTEDRERWEKKYSEKPLPEVLVPDKWLAQCLQNQSPGRALDFACGLGHNAIWLTQQGWQVDAVDISPTALRLATGWAEKLGVDGVHWILADLEECILEEHVYDLVIVFRFLDRVPLPRLIESVLKPGGQLVYETFHRNHLNRPEYRMKNPDFTLKDGELRQLYSGMEIVEFIDALEQEDRCISRLYATK